MPASPRRPVCIGGGQLADRPDDPRDGLEPLALMAEAAHRAADDAGAGHAVLAAVDTLAVVHTLTIDYGDAPGLLAERLGCHPARTLRSTIGGNTPQALVHHLADEIAAGRTEIALIVGAEAWHTMRVLGQAGETPSWTPPRPPRGERWGEPRLGFSEHEGRHGLRVPAVAYPLAENALRAATGQSIVAHRAELAAFCGRLAIHARGHPTAWDPRPPSARTIGTVTPANRMIAFPYPKRMNANLDVNQGAALLLASETAAKRLGVPVDRWVYPWAGVDVHEHWFLQDRRDYHSLPALARAAAALFETTGCTSAAIAHLDLYSCFPIAPRLAAATLGLRPDDPRPLTLTGGLPWFGGPGSNYATHAIVTLLGRLRADRGSVGLVHALGWVLTEHALGLYSTTPPRAWRRAGGPRLQAEVDTLPHPRLAHEPSGRGTIETYTIVHDREGGPARGVVIGRLADDRRFIATLPPARDVLEAMEQEEPIGRPGRVRTTAGRAVFIPG